MCYKRFANCEVLCKVKILKGMTNGARNVAKAMFTHVTCKVDPGTTL